MDNLKPCPFCGSKTFGGEVHPYHYTIFCACGAEVMSEGTREDVEKAWNTRANEDRTIVLPVPIGGKVYVPYRHTVIAGEKKGLVIKVVDELSLCGYIKEGDREFYATCVGNCRKVDIETGQVFITREDAEKWLRDNPGKEV